MATEEEKIVPLSLRRGVLPPRWRWWMMAIQPGGVAVILLVLVLIGGVFWLRIDSTRRMIEALQTPALQGQALVEDKMILPRKHSVVLSLTFVVEKHSISFTTEQGDKWQRTQVGDTVAVTYHIGKYDNYYIEDWQPVVRKEKVSLHP
ncbi:MAG TPA: hypothetical protein VKU00_19100 [Chthonomonadaceae bacterium]|nr:hypothetical protein [Chthonomonadaceae bacterium]